MRSVNRFHSPCMSAYNSRSWVCAQNERVIKTRFKNEQRFHVVSWCFEPSQPQRITSGLDFIEYIMKCHITLWTSAFVNIFDIFWLFVFILDKQPADCKLLFGTISDLHADLCQHFAIWWYQFSDSHGISLLPKLTLLAHVVHVFYVFSVQSRACVELTGCWIEIDECISHPLIKS